MALVFEIDSRIKSNISLHSFAAILDTGGANACLGKRARLGTEKCSQKAEG